jgi:hypothetical protein
MNYASTRTDVKRGCGVKCTSLLKQHAELCVMANMPYRPSRAHEVADGLLSGSSRRVCVMRQNVDAWSFHHLKTSPFRSNEVLVSHANRAPCLLLIFRGRTFYANMTRTIPTATLTTHKTCPTCGTSKPLAQFWKSKFSKYGVQAHCKICQAVRKRGEPSYAPQPVKVSKIAKPPKSVAKVIPEAAELIVDLPGIYEVQNRGKGYTSFRFESPIDGSVFSFSSFREARTGRQEMMRAFRQQAVFESVVRQKTGKKPADDEDTE